MHVRLARPKLPAGVSGDLAWWTYELLAVKAGLGQSTRCAQEKKDYGTEYGFFDHDPPHGFAKLIDRKNKNL